jgi:biopolymer transport protein ExbD
MAALSSLFLILGVCTLAMRVPCGIETAIAVKADCLHATKHITVHAAADGRLFVNGAATPPQALARRLREIFAAQSERVVFVSADPDVPFERVVQAIDDAAAQADRVALAAPHATCMTLRNPPFLDIALRPAPAIRVTEVPVWRIWK